MVQGYELKEDLCEKCSMPRMGLEGSIICVVCPVLQKQARKGKLSHETETLRMQKEQLEKEVLAYREKEGLAKIVSLHSAYENPPVEETISPGTQIASKIAISGTSAIHESTIEAVKSASTLQSQIKDLVSQTQTLIMRRELLEKEASTQEEKRGNTGTLTCVASESSAAEADVFLKTHNTSRTGSSIDGASSTTSTTGSSGAGLNRTEIQEEYIDFARRNKISEWAKCSPDQKSIQPSLHYSVAEPLDCHDTIKTTMVMETLQELLPTSSKLTSAREERLMKMKSEATTMQQNAEDVMKRANEALEQVKNATIELMDKSAISSVEQKWVREIELEYSSARDEPAESLALENKLDASDNDNETESNMEKTANDTESSKKKQNAKETELSDCQNEKENLSSEEQLYLDQWEQRRLDGMLTRTRRLLAGWSELPDLCLGEDCRGAHLLSKGRRMECAVCSGSGNGEDGAYAPCVITKSPEELRLELWATLRHDGMLVKNRRLLVGWTEMPDECRGLHCGGIHLLSNGTTVECLVCGGSGSGSDGAYDIGEIAEVCESDGGDLRVGSPMAVASLSSDISSSYGVERAEGALDSKPQKMPREKDVTSETSKDTSTNTETSKESQAGSLVVKPVDAKTNNTLSLTSSHGADEGLHESVQNNETTRPLAPRMMKFNGYRRKVSDIPKEIASPGFQLNPSKGKAKPSAPSSHSIHRPVRELEEDFDAKRSVVSKEIGKRLLKGWTLLDMACPYCVMPLMTDKVAVNEICVLCGPVRKHAMSISSGTTQESDKMNSLDGKSTKLKRSLSLKGGSAAPRKPALSAISIVKAEGEAEAQSTSSKLSSRAPYTPDMISEPASVRSTIEGGEDIQSSSSKRSYRVPLIPQQASKLSSFSTKAVACGVESQSVSSKTSNGVDCTLENASRPAGASTEVSKDPAPTLQESAAKQPPKLQVAEHILPSYNQEAHYHKKKDEVASQKCSSNDQYHHSETNTSEPQVRNVREVDSDREQTSVKRASSSDVSAHLEKHENVSVSARSASRTTGSSRESRTTMEKVSDVEASKQPENVAENTKAASETVTSVHLTHPPIERVRPTPLILTPALQSQGTVPKTVVFVHGQAKESEKKSSMESSAPSYLRTKSSAKSDPPAERSYLYNGGRKKMEPDQTLGLFEKLESPESTDKIQILEPMSDESVSGKGTDAPESSILEPLIAEPTPKAEESRSETCQEAGKTVTPTERSDSEGATPVPMQPEPVVLDKPVLDSLPIITPDTPAESKVLTLEIPIDFTINDGESLRQIVEAAKLGSTNLDVDTKVTRTRHFAPSPGMAAASAPQFVMSPASTRSYVSAACSAAKSRSSSRPCVIPEVDMRLRKTNGLPSLPSISKANSSISTMVDSMVDRPKESPMIETRASFVPPAVPRMVRTKTRTKKENQLRGLIEQKSFTQDAKLQNLVDASFDQELVSTKSNGGTTLDSTGLDELMARIEETRSKLKSTLEESESVQNRSHLREIIDSLAQAADDMQQIDFMDTLE
jgi:uncharacterized Zn finger protein (UPF0148 family)